MHQKDYILNMIKSLQTGTYTRQDIIHDVFTGAASSAADEDIQTEVKKSLLYLVKESILTAMQAENIIRKHYPNLISEKNQQRKARSIARPSPTLFGPFPDIHNSGTGPVVIDMSRMPQSWIEEFNNGTEQDRATLLAPHIAAFNARQEEPA